MRTILLIFILVIACEVPFAAELDDSHLGSIDSSKVERPLAIDSAKWPLAKRPNNPQMSIDFAKDLYRFGYAKQVSGRLVSWAGLTIGAVGAFSKQPVLAGAGFIGMLAGIPLNGLGASDMVSAANRLNPENHIDASGWNTYAISGAGVGLGALLGVAGWLGASKNGRFSSENDTAFGMLIIGASLFTIGSVMQIVAWDEFSDDADRAIASRARSPYALSIEPSFIIKRNGGITPGASLALIF